MRFRLALALLLVLGLAAPLAAKQARIFPGNPWPLNKPLPESEYRYFSEQRESFSIAWFVLGDLEDGGALFCNVMITNMGVGDANATLDLTWIDPQGRDHFVRGEFKPDSLSAAKDRFEIKIGQSYLGGKYPDFRLKVVVQGMTVDLKLTARVSGWRPNSGYAYFSEDKRDYYCARIPIPNADLQGTIALDGKTHPVRGRAYMDHAPVTMLPHKYADRWQSLRSLRGEYTIDYLEFRTPPEYGAQLATWIIVAQGGKTLLATTAAKLTPGEWVKDPRTGLSKPQRIGFEAAADGYSIKGEVRVQREIEYIDILSKLSLVERTVAGLFAKSHIWRCRSQVSATLIAPDGSIVKIEQPGISEILYVGD